MSSLKISVITTAYNHQETLQRAINSVNNQRDVNFEHIIIDDTDTHNGMMKTYQSAFKRCAGEYIAFCDGDDYWIDPYKLYKQLRHMEKYRHCALCVTRVYNEKDGRRTEMPIANYVNEHISFDSLLCGNAYVHAQSYLIRKSIFDEYIDFDMFVEKFNLWDYPIILELIQHGTIYCLDYYTAVNTVNDESVTHTRDRRKRFRYLYDQFKIKWYYIKKYGCKTSTKIYLIYKILRHLYSIGFKRWTK